MSIEAAWRSAAAQQEGGPGGLLCRRSDDDCLAIIITAAADRLANRLSGRPVAVSRGDDIGRAPSLPPTSPPPWLIPHPTKPSASAPYAHYTLLHRRRTQARRRPAARTDRPALCPRLPQASHIILASTTRQSPPPPSHRPTTPLRTHLPSLDTVLDGHLGGPSGGQESHRASALFFPSRALHNK